MLNDQQKQQYEEMRKATILLYCKWCPHDCKGLTKEEKLGCLASGGFADEFLALKDMAIIAKDQSLPKPPIIQNRVSLYFGADIIAAREAGYKKAQQDMFDFRRILPNT